jgi:hypothetical protein
LLYKTKLKIFCTDDCTAASADFQLLTENISFKPSIEEKEGSHCT